MRRVLSLPSQSVRGKLIVPDQPEALRVLPLRWSCIQAHMMRRPLASTQISGAKNMLSVHVIRPCSSGVNLSVLLSYLPM